MRGLGFILCQTRWSQPVELVCFRNARWNPSLTGGFGLQRAHQHKHSYALALNAESRAASAGAAPRHKNGCQGPPTRDLAFSGFASQPCIASQPAYLVLASYPQWFAFGHSCVRLWRNSSALAGSILATVRPKEDKWQECPHRPHRGNQRTQAP